MGGTFIFEFGDGVDERDSAYLFCVILKQESLSASAFPSNQKFPAFGYDRKAILIKPNSYPSFQRGGTGLLIFFDLKTYADSQNRRLHCCRVLYPFVCVWLLVERSFSQPQTSGLRVTHR